MVCVHVHDIDACAGGRIESCVPDEREVEESGGKKNRVRLSRGTTATTTTSGETQISYMKSYGGGGGGGGRGPPGKTKTKIK